jgi:hypothetical protein
MATSTTTWRAITDKQVSVITALVPTSLSPRRFRLLQEDIDFESWLAKNPTASLRRFTVEDTSIWETPPLWNVDVRQVTGSARFRISYPRTYGAYGREGIRDAQQVSSEDISKVVSALEDPSNYVAGQHSCLVTAQPTPLSAVIVTEFDCSFIYYESS